MTPEQLKISILRHAIQGKLVEQRQEEDKVDLSYIKFKQTEDIEFDIPENWTIAHLESITKSVSSKQYQISASDFKQTGRYPVVSQSNEFIIGYNDDETKLYCHDNPVIIFGDHTTEVKYVDFNFIVGADGVKIFEPIEDVVNGKFLKYVLEYYSIGLEKVGGYSRHYKFIKDKAFPIPPLAEQKRIVAKIEELLPIVERYAASYEKLKQFNAKFPEDLKKSILKYAIQGKLVEQRQEEGTAEELYQKILCEKQRLIMENKIKKEKPLADITGDDIPFDIPTSWKWVRIGDVFQHNTGKALNSANKTGTLMTYITTSNLYWNKFILENLKEMYFTDSEIDKCTVEKGDLLVCEGGDIGRAAIWESEIPMRIQNHIHRLRAYTSVSVLYFYYVFYFYKSANMITGKGMGIKELSSRVLHSLLIPLPPLAEQKRIAAKIEELLPYCDKLIRINDLPERQ